MLYKKVFDLPKGYAQKSAIKVVFKWSKDGRGKIWDHLNTSFARVFDKWRGRPPAALPKWGRRPLAAAPTLGSLFVENPSENCV